MERKTLEHTVLIGCLHQIPPPQGSGNSTDEEKRKRVRTGGERRRQENKVSKSMEQSSQRLRQQAHSQHGSASGPLCVYYNFGFSYNIYFYENSEFVNECLSWEPFPSLDLPCTTSM